MKPLIIIRPQPGCEASLSAAKALGLDTHAFPMFEVRPLPWESPAPDTFDALLVGSANALRHGGIALSAYAGKPTYAVGASTAQACRDAGLEVIATGKGSLQGVLDELDPAHTRLLRLAGATRVQIEPPPSVTIAERTVYSSDPQPMPDALGHLLHQENCVVALHSAEAARHFRGECERLGIDMARIALATIGPRVANAANGGWHDVQSAESPDEDALLALAHRMCEETQNPQPAANSTSHSTPQEPMQDQTGTSAIAATLPPMRRRSLRGQMAVALIAFLLGAALVIWSVWSGYLRDMLPAEQALSQTQINEMPAKQGSMAAQSAASEDTRDSIAAVSTVEARLAMLEDRFSRLNFQANAASGHAARAENLLIAFAARRMIDRGEPLRYLADQLQLRFANSQPRAVRTIIEFAKSPVTIDGLSARLEALGPELAGQPRDESFWQSSWRNLSSLFKVRREASQVVRSESRIERARVMLRAGRISSAIEEVERLPGADAAATWIADAQHYAEAQQALDLIETTAIIEPSRLSGSERDESTQNTAATQPPTPATTSTPSR